MTDIESEYPTRSFVPVLTLTLVALAVCAAAVALRGIRSCRVEAPVEPRAEYAPMPEKADAK